MSYVKYNIGVFCQEYEPENEWCKSAKKTPAVDSEEGMRLLPPPSLLASFGAQQLTAPHGPAAKRCRLPTPN